jgi:Leucine-rich repeat (LRR) protein
MMRSNASQAVHLAAWGKQHQVAPAHLDRIRRALDSGQRELDLSAIAVSTVPSFLRGEGMLHSLTLRFAAEKYVHIDVTTLPRLRTLRIVGSEMQNLAVTGKERLQVHPSARCALEVGDSMRLEEMKMRTNAFDTLHVWDVPRLRVLDVSTSRLRHLAVVNASELERLDASMNPLPDEGLELSEVDQLTTIRLASGRLRRVPRAVREATALRELDLRRNLIEVVGQADLPPSLASLDLSNNSLSEGPLDWACRASLRDLNLQMNCIAGLSSTIGTFKRLETLDLSHNDMVELPAAIGRCNLLRVLKLSSNRLVRLPPEVCELTALEALHLDHNALRLLPADMHRLIRLDSLRLERNALSGLPGRLDQLPIRQLILHGNPDFCMHGPLLRERTHSGQTSFPLLSALDLGDTRLCELPAGLGFRSGLVQLRLRGNPRLRDLPDDISKLSHLRWLDLSGCGFRRLPHILERMSVRAQVFLHRNPLDQSVPQGERSPEAGAHGKAPRVPWCVVAEVRAWRALIGKDLTREQLAFWNERFPSGNSDAFAYLLAGLRALPEYQQSSSAGQTRFCFGVHRLLLDIEEHPELSGYIFDEAEMNAAILADRHRLSFDRLALTARLHALAKGVHSDGLVAARRVRDAFRRESVAAIAARYAAAHAMDTEVELDLAYRIFLSREPGGFSFGYDAQLDERCPRVDGEHIRELIAIIRQVEQRELVGYLCEAPVWRRYLMRSRTVAYLSIVASFDVRIEACFNPCLPGDAGAEERLAHNRLMFLAQREEAVLAWLRSETIALLTDNPLLAELA